MNYADLPPNLKKAYDAGTYRPPTPFSDAPGSGGGQTGGGFQAPSAPSVGPGMSPTTNTAGPDPNLSWLSDKYKSRFDTSNTARAIDRSNASIADSAALMNKDAQASLASRGARGGGVAGAFIQKNITDKAQRQAAGAAADISQGEQTRLDNLTMGGSGIMGAQGQLALGQQSLANQQYATSANIALQQQQMVQQQQQQQLQALLSIMHGI